jgi:hypothetical protein
MYPSRQANRLAGTLSLRATDGNTKHSQDNPREVIVTKYAPHRFPSPGKTCPLREICTEACPLRGNNASARCDPFAFRKIRAGRRSPRCDRFACRGHRPSWRVVGDGRLRLLTLRPANSRTALSHSNTYVAQTHEMTTFTGARNPGSMFRAFFQTPGKPAAAGRDDHLPCRVNLGQLPKVRSATSHVHERK